MRLVFIDLETGGLDPARHPITQIAAVAVDRGMEKLDEFEAKVKFDPATADPEALKLSSYDPDVWAAKALEPGEVIEDLNVFLKQFADLCMVSQRTGNPYYVAQIAGYNAATFDGPFLQAFYRQRNAFLPAAFRVLCILQRTLWHFHESPAIKPPADFKLGTVCKHFGIELAEAHDALADARATVALYRILAQPATAAAS